MDRYLELIPSQHCDKPKFMAWLTVSMTATNDVTQALRQFTSAFDLDKAVGKQLDILGEYVGVGRVLDFQPADGSSPVLNDEIFRTLIRTRIVKNHWDGTIRQIHELWDALFPL